MSRNCYRLIPRAENQPLEPESDVNTGALDTDRIGASCNKTRSRDKIPSRLDCANSSTIVNAMQSIENADLVLLVAGLAGLLLVGLLYSLRQYQNSNRELQSRFETSQHNEYSLRESLHAAEKNGQAKQLELEKERELAAQKIEQFEENRRQLKIEFENLANKILEDKARAFDKTNKDSLEALLKPFREQVEGFQKRVNDVHSESLKGNASLESEIKKVLEVGLKMGSDAQNLTDALKGDSQKRGSWGETQLEKTLQMSGLIEFDHYEKQTSMQDAEGKRKQTDFLIKLPDDKHIVIDSKV